ncbi:MAG TPA: AAA family ATPase [Syntrophomonadaceae bacterium]|nr:AAA family ATPase [Syntrophomonadaceae bacterium]
MKVITIINGHPGSGQTTVTVNLATGLLAKGRRVLILDWGNNQKLIQWLGTVPLQTSQGCQAPGPPITSTRLGVDLLSFACVEGGQTVADALVPFMEGTDYEYILIHPASIEHAKQLIDLPYKLAVCTDLEHLDELGLIRTLQQNLGVEDDARPVDLIISNKINTKEWEHNSQQLFALGDYFGYETLADPIPHCERIHDLPLTGWTVWDLQQENLKSAFTRLVATVEEL